MYGNPDKDLRNLVGELLEERINRVIERRVQEGLLENIGIVVKDKLAKEFGESFKKVEALDEVVNGLKKLFGE